MSAHVVPVICIDGPSGSGKGTLSLIIANQLRWHFLDSGAIYRALSYYAMQQGVFAAEEAKLTLLAEILPLRFAQTEAKDQQRQIQIYLGESEVSQQIRSEACGHYASQVSVFSLVRQALLQRQRDFRKAPGLVADGRDMGTVVFPDATLKIFLTANAEVRAQRRMQQLKQQGIDANLGQLLYELKMRDDRDTNRTVAPLKPAEDALMLDNSDMSANEAADWVLSQFKNYQNTTR